MSECLVNGSWRSPSLAESSVTDVGVKSSPILSKSGPKSNSFYVRVRFIIVAPKVANHLGYFWWKFCHQELLKIAQSGHIGWKSTKARFYKDILSVKLRYAHLKHSEWLEKMICLSLCSEWALDKLTTDNNRAIFFKGLSLDCCQV